MVKCSVINCKVKSDQESSVRLFRIPTAVKNQCAKTKLLSERRRAYWIERIKILRDEDIKPQNRVCGRHFVTGENAALFDFTNIDWAPSLFMGYDQSRLDPIIERQKRELFEAVTNLENSLLRRLNMPIVERADSTDAVGLTSSTVQIVETLVCEPSICDLPLSEQSEDEVNHSSEDCVGPLQNKNLLETDTSSGKAVKRARVDDMSNAKTGLFEEVPDLRAVLAESTDEKAQLSQKLSDCQQNIIDLKAELDALRKINSSLKENNGILKNTVANLTLHEDALRNDDSKVAYYTGLPSFILLMHVFGLVSKEVPNSPLYILPKFQQFLMVLMRLRLSLHEQDLAYRFNVSVSTISRTFNKWLLAMSHSLEQFIKWPDRDSLISSMPQSFKREWGNSIGIIIHCFEVVTNKHDNNVKFLIGITPQGTISYISPAHDACTDDKTIVEECGILNNLLPNDIIMADGSNVAESMGFTGARLVIPTTTKGKALLCYDDAELSKKNSNVRIHVDRLVGQVTSKYTFLKSVVPIEYINKKDGEENAQIDHIVRVCCALTNLCPLSVPPE